MNNKAMSKLFATILIAVVLIIAFVVPLAIFSLITTEPSSTGGSLFAIDDLKQTGSLGIVIRVADTMQPIQASVDLWIRTDFGIAENNPCTATGWIALNTNTVSGPILVPFTSGQISGPFNSFQRYTGQAQTTTEIIPGDYIFGMRMDCIFPNDVNSILWTDGGNNAGTAGIVRADFCEDYDENNIWNCPPELRRIHHLVIEGTSAEGPPTPPNGEPVNITEDGEPGLIDTAFAAITEADQAQATTQIIIGILILIVGFGIAGVGRGNTIIFIIGFTIIIVGLIVIAVGAIPFFAPAILGKEKAYKKAHTRRR